MKILNYSAEHLHLLYNWLPHDLKAEKVIFFPDACPGKSPLPTGTVVFTKQENWRKFAVSDCGCGMLLAKSTIHSDEFDASKWDNIYFDLKKNKGKLGDLGSGNHFLDVIKSRKDGRLYFLIHTGSRNESKLVDDLVENPKKFDAKFNSVCDWAFENRLAILKTVEKHFGKLEIVLDKNHNHFEFREDGVVIRKGASRVKKDELTVIPSSMIGDVVLVRATNSVENVYNSLCHGTGRTMSRSDAKKISKEYDFSQIREKIYIPKMIENNSIKTDAPFCYRNLDDCLSLIQDLIIVEERYVPIGYLGQI